MRLRAEIFYIKITIIFLPRPLRPCITSEAAPFSERLYMGRSKPKFAPPVRPSPAVGAAVHAIIVIFVRELGNLISFLRGKVRVHRCRFVRIIMIIYIHALLL